MVDGVYMVAGTGLQSEAASFSAGLDQNPCFISDAIKAADKTCTST